MTKSKPSQVIIFIKQFFCLLMLTLLGHLCLNFMSFINMVNLLFDGDAIVNGMVAPFVILLVIGALLAYGVYYKDVAYSGEIVMHLPSLIPSAVIVLVLQIAAFVAFPLGFLDSFLVRYPQEREMELLLQFSCSIDTYTIICVVFALWTGFYGTKYLLSRHLRKQKS